MAPLQKEHDLFSEQNLSGSYADKMHNLADTVGL